MRLIDAITNVVIPDSLGTWDHTAPPEAICEDLGIANSWCFTEATDRALKSFPIFNWVCTDTHVGLNALYLNGEPVGCTYQSARKNHIEVEWISLEHANRVREFILANTERGQPTLMDPNQDIGDDFAVSYVGQALTNQGFYEGRPVTALIWYDGLMGRTTPEEFRRPGRAYTVAVDYHDPKSNHVLIQDGDDERTIPITEFKLAFNLR